MHYQGNIFRPPSEADSILLQVTTGCSHNKCTFCGMYKGSRFAIKDEAIIQADLEFASRHCHRQDRLFLCDGDALIIPQKRLVALLTDIRRKLPWLTRVGSYANTRAINSKTVAELTELRELGLSIAYMGLESGDDLTLQEINKGADSRRMIEMAAKIRQAGIKLSITVLLGIAQARRSAVHAAETGRVLTAIDPEYVGVLSLMPTPGTPLHAAWTRGEFELLDADAMLVELRQLLAATELTDGYFHANHASNYLPIKARLPRDKESTLALIDQALTGRIGLKPEYLRGL
jgi:radical SAM superfamily enzyme YgiQ (UPF0313 family)